MHIKILLYLQTLMAVSMMMLMVCLRLHSGLTGEKPDRQRYPMIPFGSIVMAHITVSQHSSVSQRSNDTYCIGTSRVNEKGLKLCNPQTKKEIK